jgi:Chitin binding Peritrophin-A domain
MTMAIGHDGSSPTDLPDGFYGDIHNPRTYHKISNGIVFTFQCGYGLVWDASLQSCNGPERADTSYLVSAAGEE